MTVKVASTCAEFRALDTKYGIDKRSPLHHDNRPSHECDYEDCICCPTDSICQKENPITR